MALEYKSELQSIDPRVEYLMTLYLSPELTPDEIRKAARAGIVGWCAFRIWLTATLMASFVKASNPTPGALLPTPMGV